MKSVNQGHLWASNIWERIPLLSTTLNATGNSAADQARARLIHTLKSAHSGELGAIHAYQGHALSVTDFSEKKMIQHIEYEEVVHRERVGEMLRKLGERPSIVRDTPLGWIGKVLGFLCRWTGWFAPMYGAGLLESRNIREYEEAALYALEAGHIEFLDDLLIMAEVEWEHEKFFREKCQTHRLYPWVPKWPLPPAKESIRKPFADLNYPEGALRAII